MVFDICWRERETSVVTITRPRPDRTIMDYGAKSMAANAGSNVDINVDMDEVLKRIQTSRNVAGPGSVSRLAVLKDFHLELFSEWSLVQSGIGVMVINNEGIPLKTTLDSSTTVNLNIPNI